MHRTAILQCEASYLALPRKPLHRFLNFPFPEFSMEQLAKVIPATAGVRVTIAPVEELGVSRISRQGLISPEKVFSPEQYWVVNALLKMTESQAGDDYYTPGTYGALRLFLRLPNDTIVCPILLPPWRKRAIILQEECKCIWRRAGANETVMRGEWDIRADELLVTACPPVVPQS